MSLCRYLPTPSDRMAVMWSLLTVGDAVVLEYGPAGTTHYSMGLFGAMGISPNQALFTTHMSEDDVVMGDVTRLEEAILELDRNYAPKVIFVIASAITSVIGTDLKGVCHYMQAKVKARLVAMENGGFKGDYTVGLREVQRMLVQELSGCGEGPSANTYNVLGASAGAYRIHSDLWELQDLMSRAFGFSCGAVPGVKASVDQLAAMGGARLNLVLRAEGLEAARWLKERYGTPYVYGAPYGYGGTEKWLKAVGEALGASVAPEVTSQLQEKKKEAMTFRMYASMYRNKPHPPAAAIVGNYDTVVGLAGLCRELDITPDLLICAHTLKDIEEPAEGVVHFERERDTIDALRRLRSHLVMADDVSLHLCDETNVGVCVSFPLVSHTQIANHLPLMGIRGTDFLLETVDRYYQNLD